MVMSRLHKPRLVSREDHIVLEILDYRRNDSGNQRRPTNQLTSFFNPMIPYKDPVRLRPSCYSPSIIFRIFSRSRLVSNGLRMNAFAPACSSSPAIPSVVCPVATRTLMLGSMSRNASRHRLPSISGIRRSRMTSEICSRCCS